MVSIDLTKAFYRVNLNALRKILKKLGVHDSMLNIIVSFHQGIKASVFLLMDDFQISLMLLMVQNRVV